MSTFGCSLDFGYELASTIVIDRNGTVGIHEGEVDEGAVKAVRHRRAGRTPRRVVGPEHEVVDEELRAPFEEVRQRGAPLVGLESILLVDPNPRQLLPLPPQLVAAPRELLLRLAQLGPAC